MAAQFRVKPGVESTTPSGPARFAELDTETQDGAFRALGAAALTYACAYLVAFATDWILSSVAVGHFTWPRAFDGVVTVIAIVYSAFVGLRCRRRSCPCTAFSRMAMVFLVVTSLGIAAQNWGWEQSYLAGTYEFGVSWTGVWIVMYATIVTLPPRQILVASLLAWSMLPGTAMLSLLVHGTPAGFPGSPTLAILRMATPVFICVGIAYACAYRVFFLAKSVSRARRLGSYELLRRIGTGGMGEVWTAKHRMLRRPAAIKLIRPESLASGNAEVGRMVLRRFEREAQATAMLTSPHSIVLYDFGIGEDGVFYYVMELLEGRDLKSLVEEFGPLPAERAIHLLRAACDSLADAHHRGLIHRDVKPANLFTCRRGREFDILKVLDFGLVRDVDDSAAVATQLTTLGATSGTPGFMAPEAVTGERDVDGRADIYGLGCVAYWLLTGQMVFDGQHALAVLVQHVQAEPPSMISRTEIEIPPRLDDIVRACLAKHPGDRPRTVEQLSGMLAEVAATLPAWTRERAERWWRVNLPDLHVASIRGAVDPVARAANGS